MGPDSRTSTFGVTRAARLVAAVAIASLSLVSCLPGPAPTPSPSSPIAVSPTPETPSPSPSESASPEVSATPTPSPTPTPTPKPATLIVEEAWQSVRSMYPWVPGLSVLVARVPEGEAAYYAGIQNGLAVILVQPNANTGIDGWLAWHEAGHAVLDVASRLSLTSTDDLLTAYWALRNFPGTWQESQRKAEAAVAAGQIGFIVHQMWPQEMFADTFAATHLDSFADGTIFPGIAYDHSRMRAFYATLPSYMTTLVVTKALGPLQGQWTFVNRAGSYAAPFGRAPYPGRSEIWATPVGGAIPRYVATYLSNLGPGRPDTNDVSRQLSPDGKHLVISAGIALSDSLRYALMMLDLETGASRLLTVDSAFDDVAPAWSPDGTRIAFSRWSVGSSVDAGLWLITPDGSGLRRLVDTSAGGKRLVYGWTADSRGIATGIDGGGPYSIVDAGSGAASLFAGYATAAGSWRAGAPSFVGAFSDDAFAKPHIDVADGPAVGQRIVVRSGSDTLARPRWRPGAAEFLYLALLPGSGSIGLAGPAEAPRALATKGDVVLAEWTSAGDVVYVAQDSPLSATLRLIGADGSSPRDLVSIPRLLLSWDESYRGLASFTYR